MPWTFEQLNRTVCEGGKPKTIFLEWGERTNGRGKHRLVIAHTASPVYGVYQADTVAQAAATDLNCPVNLRLRKAGEASQGIATYHPRRVIAGAGMETINYHGTSFPRNASGVLCRAYNPYVVYPWHCPFCQMFRTADWFFQSAPDSEADSWALLVVPFCSGHIKDAMELAAAERYRPLFDAAGHFRSFYGDGPIRPKEASKTEFPTWTAFRRTAVQTGLQPSVADRIFEWNDRGPARGLNWKGYLQEVLRQIDCAANPAA